MCLLNQDVIKQLKPKPFYICRGCGPVHKPFAYHAGARHSFPGGDNAMPQTEKQTANKGCTIVHLKWRLQVDIPEAHKSLVPRRLVRLTISHTNGSTWKINQFPKITEAN